MGSEERNSLGDGLRSIFAKFPGGSKLIDRIEAATPVADRKTFNRKEEVDAIYERAGAQAWMVDLATVWRIGFGPVAPGTVVCLPTTILGLAAVFLLGPFTTVLFFALIAVVTSILCVVIEKPVERHFGGADPTAFVLDEVAGYAVTLALAPPFLGLLGPIAAFFAFRFFDIFKPGIHAIESLPIPGKIVWDDVAAGILGAISIQIVAWGGLFLWKAIS